MGLAGAECQVLGGLMVLVLLLEHLEELIWSLTFCLTLVLISLDEALRNQRPMHRDGHHALLRRSLPAHRQVAD